MASELCIQANEHYVNEQYTKAIELYTDALKVDDKRDDILCHRAQSYWQLGMFSEAIEDCDKALELNENNLKAFLKKGSALFQLNEFEKALAVFKEGHKRFETDDNFTQWIQKCEEKLPKASSVEENSTSNFRSTQPAQIPVPSGPPKVKYDWYQTHTHVVVTLLVKNVKKENLTVDSEKRKLKVDIVEPSVSLDLTLAHLVDPVQTAVKIFSTKIEIKLKKGEGIQWSKLEGSIEEEEKVCPLAAAPIQEEPPRYPSSSHHTRDWDKIAKEVTEEEKDEKLEGDAALNQFFQKIYADASDETKKAMMKSFSESGGTVLSTNWDEVGAKKVEVKPPDGMEFKKWES
ncbi:unnamed protein product [Lymnaea stagnalis]|uniref:Uncharacterized protein n=1 Tax=Lymnaea stagnalis TaxID=6523 RepID=A0AAV2IGW9_LYMST